MNTLLLSSIFYIIIIMIVMIRFDVFVVAIDLDHFDYDWDSFFLVAIFRYVDFDTNTRDVLWRLVSCICITYYMYLSSYQSETSDNGSYMIIVDFNFKL